MKNILNINEVKLNKIRRKDYITRSLKKFADDFEIDNIKWITFEEFKKTQREIIAKDKDITDDLTLEKICSEINDLDLEIEEEKNKINTDNNLKNNENEELEINDSLINDELDNSKSEDNIKENNDIKENNLIEENSFEDANICQLLEDKNRLNTGLLNRLLNNEAFAQYKDIIVNAKKNNTKKRIRVSGDSDDEELIKNLYEKAEKKNVKRQIRYPKKNN